MYSSNSEVIPARDGGGGVMRFHEFSAVSSRSWGTTWPSCGGRHPRGKGRCPWAHAMHVTGSAAAGHVT